MCCTRCIGTRTLHLLNTAGSELKSSCASITFAVTVSVINTAVCTIAHGEIGGVHLTARFLFDL